MNEAIQELTDKVVEFRCGNRKAADKWLHERREVFGNKSALELAQCDGGIEQVEKYIQRLRFGL